MNAYNKIILIGRLGHDPITRTTQKGNKVVTFSLATDDFIRSRNERETTWHRIVVWGNAADFCERYIKKGQALFVEGSMKVRKFESEGKMNYMHEVQASSIKSLGYKKDAIEIDSVESADDELDSNSATV